jgi:hypothetical protein
MTRTVRNSWKLWARPLRKPGWQVDSSALVRTPNLPPCLPLASRVKPLQLNDFERQALFLLATPTVYRMKNHKMKNEDRQARHELPKFTRILTPKTETAEFRAPHSERIGRLAGFRSPQLPRPGRSAFRIREITGLSLAAWIPETPPNSTQVHHNPVQRFNPVNLGELKLNHR